MSTGSTIGGIVGLIAGGAAILYGLTKNPGITVQNDQGQSAPMSGDGAKWVLIIVGVVLAVGGIITLVKGGGS